ncbi:MAG: VOC family protein [Erysipelotrichaceae bacterium]|jgi:lactoylglutathione lyase|nr:VOC family protein [Erysipelotrichaceae bacterium]
MIHGYHHVGLYVKNIKDSLAFYVDGLKGKVVSSFPMGQSDQSIYLVDLGENAVVELIPRGTDKEQANPRFAHIALASDEVDKDYELALKAGARSQSAPREMNLGDMQVVSAFVQGPDHEVIEFFQVKGQTQ